MCRCYDMYLLQLSRRILWESGAERGKQRLCSHGRRPKNELISLAGCAKKPAGREQAAPDHKKSGRNDKKNNPDNYNPNPNFCMCFTAGRAAQKSAIRRGSEARASKRKPDRTHLLSRPRPSKQVLSPIRDFKEGGHRTCSCKSRHILCRFSFLNLRRRIFLSKGSQIPKRPK